MSHETTKSRALRDWDFERRYLQGRVIDIGCGKDLVTAHAEAFDLEHGNAQEIGKLRERGGYDAVCGAHCLERMRKVSLPPMSFDIEELIGGIHSAEIISCDLQDKIKYDYQLKKSPISRIGRILFHLGQYWASLCRDLYLSDTPWERCVIRILTRFGCPVDQTAGPALAQLKIIARKQADPLATDGAIVG